MPLRPARPPARCWSRGHRLRPAASPGSSPSFGEQLDQGGRVGQGGHRDAADQERGDPAHGGQVLADQRRDVGRCTLTTTASPVRRVARWTWAMEAAATARLRSTEDVFRGARGRSRRPARRPRRSRPGPCRAAGGTASTSSSGKIPWPEEMIWPELDVGRPEPLEGVAEAPGEVGPAGRAALRRAPTYQRARASPRTSADPHTRRPGAAAAGA